MAIGRLRPLCHGSVDRQESLSPLGFIQLGDEAPWLLSFIPLVPTIASLLELASLLILNNNIVIRLGISAPQE